MIGHWHLHPKSKSEVKRERSLRFPRQLLPLLMLTLMSLVLSGCGLVRAINDWRGTADSAIDRAVGLLDRAIVNLADESSDWQIVLQDLTAQLTEETQQTLRNDVNNLLLRAPAAIGAEFRCDVDFIRKRIRQDLIRLRAKLLGLTIDPPTPSFCAVVPLAVDAAYVPSELNRLEFYGYDFDTTPVQVVMVNGSQEVDVSQFIDKPTHYHMTLNLGGNGVQINNTAQRFVLRWNGQEISSIAIIQPSTPVCATRLIDIAPSSISYLPPHTRGDRDYNGNGPRVQVKVALTPGPQSISAEISMLAEETQSDWTTAVGSGYFEIYRVDPGWRIQQLVGETYSSFNYIDDDHNKDEFAGDGPVAGYTFSGDGDDSDAGVHTAVTVAFNQLRLELVEAGNCVSPMALRVLEEQKLISPAIFDKFEPQVNAVRIFSDTQRLLAPQLDLEIAPAP